MTTIISSPASFAASCRRKKVYEDDHVLAFHDINPLAPVHILVIPKGPYVSWDDFSEKASDAEIAAFTRAVGKIARDEGLVAQGYRVLANIGLRGGQEVPHLHMPHLRRRAARPDAGALVRGLPSEAEPLGSPPTQTAI